MGKKKGKRKGRGHKGKKKGHFYKSADRKGEVMVNRTPARMHNVVAPHYYTRLEYGYTGAIALAANHIGYWSLYGNGLHYPGSPPAATFTAATAGGTTYPAVEALTALLPVGLTQLFALYNRYRVYASKVAITLTPSAAPDHLLCVYPSAGEAIYTNDFQAAQSAPYSKVITTSITNNIRENRISSYMDSPTILGYTKQQYQDSDSVAPAGQGQNPSGSFDWFWNFVVSAFNTGDAIAANVEIRVTYYCEFFDPTVNALTDH